MEDRGTPTSMATLMTRTLSQNGYALTANVRDNLGCSLCGSETGLNLPATAHDCCHCADLGRVRTGNVTRGQWGPHYETIPCPECGSRSIASMKAPAAVMLIPPLFRGAEFAKWLPDNGSPRLRCQDYVAQWPPSPSMLFLSGAKGTGKTTLACCILKAAHERYSVTGRFWPVIDLLDRYRRAMRDTATETTEAIDDELRRIRLLVLDDWGAHNETDYAAERLFAIVDFRYREMLPLVVTTNVPTNRLDARVADRMASGSVVPFEGPSRRVS